MGARAGGGARAGFQHSAFCFCNESSVAKTKINPDDVPPGSLITFIQKGLQYLELVANLNEVRPPACPARPVRPAPPPTP